MIKTVVFDIGNVLAGFNWQEMYHEKGLSGEFFDRVTKATVGNPLWNEIDRGVMSTEEIIDGFVATDPEIGDTIRSVLADVHGIVKKLDYAIPWIQDLKSRGYQVLVLSNFGEKPLKDCADAMDFLPYTDGGILSYREKLIKPDPAIYQRLFEKYNLIPNECVFIDDLEKNIEAAKKEGMQGIVFVSKQQAMEDLEKLLQEK